MSDWEGFIGVRVLQKRSENTGNRATHLRRQDGISSLRAPPKKMARSAMHGRGRGNGCRGHLARDSKAGRLRHDRRVVDHFLPDTSREAPQRLARQLKHAGTNAALILSRPPKPSRSVAAGNDRRMSVEDQGSDSRSAKAGGALAQCPSSPGTCDLRAEGSFASDRAGSLRIHGLIGEPRRRRYKEETPWIYD